MANPQQMPLNCAANMLSPAKLGFKLSCLSWTLSIPQLRHGLFVIVCTFSICAICAKYAFWKHQTVVEKKKRMQRATHLRHDSFRCLLMQASSIAVEALRTTFSPSSKSEETAVELRATLGEGERFVSLQRLLCNILQFVCCRKTSSVFVFMEVHGSSWKHQLWIALMSCITRHHCHSVPRCHGMPWEACAFASWAMLPMSSAERLRRSAPRPWVPRRG